MSATNSHSAKKKRTPKQRVVKHCPLAFSKYTRLSAWEVQNGRGGVLAVLCATAQQAWKEAANNIGAYK